MCASCLRALTAGKTGLTVFNSLNWKRRALVELPDGWTAAQERKKLAQETDTKEHIAATTSDILTPKQYTALTRGTAWSPILITPELLKFALLAVALPVGLKDIIANQDLSRFIL